MMTSSRLAVTTAILLLSWLSDCAECTEYTFTFNPPSGYTSANTQLTGSVIASYSNTYIVTQCARRCLTNPNCKSYNFIPSQQTCQLNEASHLTAPLALVTYVGSQYYLSNAWSVSAAALGPCANFPCLNNGNCTTQYPGTGANRQLTSLCVCALGWTGPTCAEPQPTFSWSDWSSLSKCSVSCGDGVQTQTRTCVSSGANVANSFCAGLSQQIISCNPGPCPAWTPWSAFGPCSTTGGCGPGVQVSTRSCSNGGTIGVDANCMGSANRTTPCLSTSCNAPVRLMNGPTYGEGRVDIYDDVTSQWLPVCAASWTQQDANVVCRQLGFPSGASSINAVGSYPSMVGATGAMTGASCVGTETNLASCPHKAWYDPTCSSGPHAGVQCIVDGRWSNFGNWSSCSVSCGSGVITQTRSCNSPPPLRGGQTCVGNASNSQPCTGPSCAVDGQWSSWGPWSQCSMSCGPGTQHSSRNCTNIVNGGSPCPGASTQTQSCNLGSCPVNCTWNPWTAWSTCNATCNGGIQYRTRTENPAQNNGALCTGNANDTMVCNTNPCPVDCVWQTWASWSSCSATCNGGTSDRVRIQTPAQNGGAPCTGAGQQNQACNTNPCPIPGQWSSWSAWSLCGVTCGGGLRSQTRTCNMTSNGVNNTLPCQPANDNIATMPCNTNPCLPVLSSCAALYLAGFQDNNYVTINPDPTGVLKSYTVFCQKNATTNVVQTIVHNQWENGVNVSKLPADPNTSGLKSASVPYVDNYGNLITVAQLIPLVSASTSCSQYVSFSCKFAPFNSLDKNSVTGTPRLTYWTSRYGDAMGYWGGATPVAISGTNTMTCACGDSGTCGTGSNGAQLRCACDNNDATLRMDSGYLTNTIDIPVSGFSTVDFGSGREGTYQMGPLICTA